MWVEPKVWNGEQLCGFQKFNKGRTRSHSTTLPTAMYRTVSRQFISSKMKPTKVSLNNDPGVSPFECRRHRISMLLVPTRKARIWPKIVYRLACLSILRASVNLFFIKPNSVIRRKCHYSSYLPRWTEICGITSQAQSLRNCLSRHLLLYPQTLRRRPTFKVCGTFSGGDGVPSMASACNRCR